MKFLFSFCQIITFFIVNESHKAIEKMLEEIQEAAEVTTPDKIKKKWRAKVESKTLDPSDLISYFQLSASYFLTVSKKDSASDIGESFVINIYRGSDHSKVCRQDKERVDRPFHFSLRFVFERAL